MKSNTASDTHTLVTKIASYLDILGGIIIIVFAITAVFSLPALLFGTIPTSGFQYIFTPASGMLPATTQINFRIGWNLVTGASFTGLTTNDISILYAIYTVGGSTTISGPALGLALDSLQFGSGGMILVVIALILGGLGLVAGFVSRNNPRIGGVIAFLVIIALLFVGFTNIGIINTSIELIGIVPLLGVGIIGVGGVLGLAISEL